MADEFDIMALMEKDEKLHPDLEPWLQTHKIGTRYLNHPLVQEMFLNLDKCALVNKRYEVKQKRLAETLAEGKVHTYVFLHERPYRLHAFKEYLVLRRLDDETYWRMVESIWTDTENVWQHKKLWRQMWSERRPGMRQYVMDAEERKQYAALPLVVNVYRGLNRDEHHEKGLAWTLSAEKAAWFALRYSGIGLVLEGQAQKQHIYALLNGRNEREVVCQRVTIMGRNAAQV